MPHFACSQRLHNQLEGFLLESLGETGREDGRTRRKRPSLVRSIVNFAFLGVPGRYLARIQEVFDEDWDIDHPQFLRRNMWMVFINGIVSEWNSYNLIVRAFLPSMRPAITYSWKATLLLS